MKLFFFSLAALSFISPLYSTEKASYKGYVCADLLFWQTKANNLSIATASSSSDFLLNAKTIQPHFEWDFGFRAGGGVIFPSRNWDLSLIFTLINNKARRHIAPEEGQFLFPQWIVPNLAAADAYAQEAHLHWRLHLGLMDFALAYQWNCGQSFSVLSSLGLRGAIIRQKDNMVFEGGTLFPGGKDEVHMKNKFFGIGPLAGLKAEWQICSLLSVFGGSSFSLAFGEIYLHQDEDATVGPTYRLKVHNVFPSTRAIANTSLGLKNAWKPLSRKRLAIELSLAWEQLFLFGQNQLMRFLSSNEAGVFAMNQGDLFLQGVTFECKVLF